MRIRNLDTFYWIASLQSFGAAAEKLSLTQPAVSARIQVLEQDLGAEVFLREVRNAELTAAGRRLLPYANRLMSLEQEILTAFSQSSSIEQTIRLGSSETIVSTWLPDFLTYLKKKHLGLSFDLIVDSTDNLRNALVAREIDLAFLMGPIAEVSVSNRHVCTFDMVLVAVPELANSRPAWDLSSVAAQTVLTFAQNTKPSRHLRELLVKHSGRNLRMTTSTSLGALIRLAKTGYGLCAMPKAVVLSELENNELVELQTTFNIPSIPFTASYISDSPINELMVHISEEVDNFLKPKLTDSVYSV